jgi:alkanesulfonate monooxygenase SsuD/methylene tetrahydromethanopterin reductase-like flavin-dependent oxidoreductase (luciferase family)
MLLGSPDDVAAQVQDYRRRYGERVHVVLRCNYPGMTAPAVAEQISLWGRAADRARSSTN